MFFGVLTNINFRESDNSRSKLVYFRTVLGKKSNCENSKIVIGIFETVVYTSTVIIATGKDVQEECGQDSRERKK